MVMPCLPLTDYVVFVYRVICHTLTDITLQQQPRYSYSLCVFCVITELQEVLVAETPLHKQGQRLSAVVHRTAELSLRTSQDELDMVEESPEKPSTDTEAETGARATTINGGCFRSLNAFINSNHIPIQMAVV